MAQSKLRAMGIRSASQRVEEGGAASASTSFQGSGGPSDPPAPPVIVGIGVPAGGGEALEAFFARVPADCEVAFVVVCAQSAAAPRLLPTVLQQHTPLPVVEIREGTRAKPGTVYVPAKGTTLMCVLGRLQPLDSAAPVPPLPIDFFFRSLAHDQRERAMGIMLSGTEGDGAAGLREIKAALGMTMVQDADGRLSLGASHRSIHGEAPDFALAPQEMPQQLIAYVRTLQRTAGRAASVEDSARSQEAMQQIFAILRARSGHDFSSYKETTVRRRIERRMNLHRSDTLSHYLEYLLGHPGEQDALFDELLIGVTSFFRDAEAFDALRTAVTELLENKPHDYGVRVWVAGCSTGEEAYSLAILFRECAEARQRPLNVQIFATDLDPKSIEVARAGVYPSAVCADLSPERHRRYFVSEGEHCRVRKEIREMIVFATQNLVEDPPFTKLDLLSCRNVLIYLDGKLQKRLLPIFHYALKPDGLAFLGSSETIGTFAHLFDTVDKKWRIFRRRKVAAGTYVADIPGIASREDPSVEAASSLLPRRHDGTVLQAAERMLLRTLVPPSAIIRERGDIVHIHGRTGQFLEPAPGPQTSVNIFTMAREGLQLELTAAVRQAAREDREVVRRGVRVRINDQSISVTLRARRILEPEAFRGLFLVSFETMRPNEAESGDPEERGVDADAALRIAELERVLQYTKESHQSTIEELETANEELKSTNEELQSTNEELQSANEELETSKEELQSLNEELQTVNIELQGKVEDLSRANDDMTNLLNATDIATLFLDNDLNIKRHTEQAKRIIRLIPSDVGRPVADLVSRLRYGSLVEDAREVLRTLVFKETEAQGEGNTWYQLRIMPYRTTENMIDGLVITFVDITRTKQLQQSERRLVESLSRSPVSVFGQDWAGRFRWTCGDVFGTRAEGLSGMRDDEAFGAENAAILQSVKELAFSLGKAVRKRVQLKLSGEVRAYDLFIEPLYNASNEPDGISCVATDVTPEVPEVTPVE